MYGMHFINPFNLGSVDGAIQPGTFFHQIQNMIEMYMDEDIHTVCTCSLGSIFP